MRRGRKKNGPQAIGKSRGGWNTKIHAAACGDTLVKGFLLSGGNVQDARAGRLLLETLGKQENTRSLLMDRAYAGYSTRLAARELRFNPVVPPKTHLKPPWDSDRELYKRRNERERFFRRVQSFRGIFTRFEKLDRLFTAFIYLAVICIALRCVNTP
jgi:transposase